MRLPECVCYKDHPGEVENRVYSVAVNTATALDSLRLHFNLCDDSLDYIVMTTVTIMLRMVAGYKSKDMNNCDAEFQAILSTLVSDVTMRDKVLDALVQRVRDGGTMQ